MLNNKNSKKIKVLKYLLMCLKKGKKERNENALKKAFALVKRFEKINPFLIFLDSVQKVKPFCKIKNVTIKGNLKKLPVSIDKNRQKNLALRWLCLNTLLQNEKTIAEKLAKELIETVLLQSKSIKMCDDLHKAVEANKIFIVVKN
jgi:small subunit ribosomal protein S7